jgi:hypothetical protein
VIARVMALALLAGCSRLLGIEEFSTPDGSVGPTADAPVDVIVEDLIAFQGRTVRTDLGNMDQSVAAQVEFVRLPDRSRIATGASDIQTGFNLLLATSGTVVDGYLKVIDPQAGFRDAYNYPPPLVGDTANFRARVVDEQTLSLIAQVSGEPFDPGGAFTILLAFRARGADGSLEGRPGIQFLGADGDVRVVYGDPQGAPSQGLTETTVSGLAYIINGPGMPFPVEALTIGQSFGRRTVDGTPNTLHVVQFEIP